MNSTLMLSRWGRKLGKSLMKATQKLKPTIDSNRRWNIITGDIVRVIQGPQIGQQGKVLQVLRQQNRILIEGVNMRRRAVRSSMEGVPGKIMLKPCTIHYSNVMLIDPTTGEPTKISRRFLEDGTKVRVSKKSGHIIPKINYLENRKPRSTITGPKDTAAVDVFNVSFVNYEKYLKFIYATENISESDKDK